MGTDETQPEPKFQVEITVAEDLHVSLDHKLLFDAVSAALKLHNVPAAEISLMLTGDTHIAELNQRYLNHEGPTDVITFDLRDDIAGPPDGEIVVSVHTAEREAIARGHSLRDELALYAVHGVLHLLGYDDATEELSAKMRVMEDRVLAQVDVGPLHLKSIG